MQTYATRLLLFLSLYIRVDSETIECHDCVCFSVTSLWSDILLMTSLLYNSHAHVHNPSASVLICTLIPRISEPSFHEHSPSSFLVCVSLTLTPSISFPIFCLLFQCHLNPQSFSDHCCLHVCVFAARYVSQTHYLCIFQYYNFLFSMSPVKFSGLVMAGCSVTARLFYSLAMTKGTNEALLSS